MVQFFSKRRLKIAEQIIIVIFFAVLIPMTVSGIIINNINQQSNRAQLRSAAVMIANIVSEEIDVFTHSINNELSQIAATLEYYNSPVQEQKYLDTIIKNLSFYKELAVVKKSELPKYEIYSVQDDYAVFDKPLKNDEYLVSKDFWSYADAKAQLTRRYQDKSGWARACILNIANSGYFSSDRTIDEYVRDIWHLKQIEFRQ